jgi:ABC-type bacteriocin/lantibiotic exporter with double-glycine peptidase domain
MIICLVLLLLQLGPSALAGFAFFILATPVQTFVMKRLFALRRKSMDWTDKRAKLLQELLGGMKVIKFFAWEIPFLERISDYRRREMGYVFASSCSFSFGINRVSIFLGTSVHCCSFVLRTTLWL